MDGVLEIGKHMDREFSAEPFAGPAMGSAGLHIALAACLVFYGSMLGLFHHNVWGNPGAGGAMQVNLVSSALPLPADQVNKNVLATDTKSQAPAAPSPKEQQHVDETAIPIPGKQAKPKPQTTPKTQMHQPQPQQNVVPYGEQAGSSMPKQMQAGPTGPTTVGDNNFASLYPWYVDQINRTMSQNWNKREVDSRTPTGTRVYLVFTIHRDGTISQLQVERTSGSPTLDVSCQRAAQRVSTFGNLPPAYNQSTLKVEFYCEY